MASPVAANLQICKEAKGQGPRPKGRATRADHKGSCPLLSPFLYSLSKSKPQPKVNAYSACKCNEQITVGTAVSPHGPGATNPVRNRLVAGRMFDHFWAGYPNSPANYIKFCNRLYSRRTIRFYYSKKYSTSTRPLPKKRSKSAANHLLWKGVWRETCM